MLMRSISIYDEIAGHRPYLYRYAIGQLRERDRAEEVVQETLLAAVESSASFQGKSSIRTWLTAILKHKIIDVRRRDAKNPIVDIAASMDGDNDIEDFDALLFREDGHWREAPPAWTSPEQSYENCAFWEVLEKCLASLPPATAKAFYLREISGMETEEICKELDISASNCWVMLYRARVSLRESLERRWFGGANRG